ncbi:hypothetical protein SAMN02910339_01347 [Lachnospiraceae bacterium YSD2013]|nr:hypothetical protein SAMN02910339_01347 [Lachnospiraceae bacterium YSD2013]
MRSDDNFMSALKRRDLKARNGISNEADDEDLIKTFSFDVLKILHEHAEEAERGSQEAIDCAIHYKELVGDNLTPVKEIEKACEYLRAEVDAIKKSRDLSVIERHLGHIEYGVIAIDHRISDWLKGYSFDYESPYCVHTLTDLLNVDSAPPVNKVKSVRKACDNLSCTVTKILRELNTPTQKGLYIANCDLNACESELHYIRALKDKS